MVGGQEESQSLGSGRGSPLGVQRLGPSPCSSQEPAFLGRSPTPGEGGFPEPRACPLLSYFPSDSESPLLSLPPGTFGSLLVCTFRPSLLCASGFRAWLQL